MITRATELDTADPLASHRARFVGAESELAYFDGNSLGRPLAATAEKLGRFVEQEWGQRLIRGWDEQWYELPLTLGDRIGRTTLGAAAGQTFVGDSTTVLLYKLARAAVDAQVGRDPRRTEIVVDRHNFPTDRYVVEGIAAERGLEVRWIETDLDLGITADLLSAHVDGSTALVLVSHVAYRSAHLVDAPELARITHEAGGLLMLDLSHSVGVVPVELDDWQVDLAAGCTYKYLNGGPGAPAFGYVASRHQESLTQPVQGWMGHADPFLMGPTYQPSAGIRRFISGTPAVLAMQPVADMISIIEEVGIAAIRAKSVALTAYAVEVAEEILSPLGVVLISPRDPAERGGHITLSHRHMRAVTAALWQQDVIPDYRDPDGLRIGLSPLSTSFDEVRRGLEAVRDTLLTITTDSVTTTDSGA